MSAQGIARRYASALADVAVARNEATEVSEELLQWTQMIKDNPSLRDVFRTPTVPIEQKQRLLETLIERVKVRPTTANLLRVALRNHRLAELEEIQKAFVEQLNQRAGVVAAQVTTAHPITPELEEALRSQLLTLTGKKVRLEFGVDENLIGGVVTRVGSTIYDGSIRSQLNEIKDKLTGGRRGEA